MGCIKIVILYKQLGQKKKVGIGRYKLKHKKGIREMDQCETYKLIP